jgi:phytoene desaturase
VSHTFAQTGPFRPRNLVAGAENVVLAGCGTTPGVGVPTVLISGKLAAARVTGGTVRRTATHLAPVRGARAAAPSTPAGIHDAA